MDNWRVEDQRITIPRHSRTDHSKRSYGGIDLDGITLLIRNDHPSKIPKANQTKATPEYLWALQRAFLGSELVFQTRMLLLTHRICLRVF